MNGKDPNGHAAHSGQTFTRTARGILLAALACYLGITFLNILSQPLGPYNLALAVACLILVFLLQLVHSAPGASAARPRSKLLTLAAQGVLSYLPLIWFGVPWGAMAGFFAGSVLLLLPARSGWTLYGLTTLSLLMPGCLHHLAVVDIVYMCQTTALTGLVVYGLSRLTALVDQLHRARTDLARLAVSNEQLRFSRDLHDLLGYSLSAITLKNELIHRLIPADPLRARKEVDEVLGISRQALADVRRVARDYREMYLNSELTSAESVLAAARVSVTVDTHEAIGRLGPATSTVLATVLREGVTNLLRHSKASYCRISARVEDGLVRLTIVNDGLVTGHQAPSSPHSGSGLGNLQQRLEDIGGRLIVRRLHDGSGADTFRITAEAPLQAARSGDMFPGRGAAGKATYGRADNIA
ncbi:histidine kinase [Streptomyces sp. NPDC006743]|uniref:sensor histidine kinase n=1 Tax=Streptomyces sp. NPDC006743 TaxID=3154480 RepID=UPI00345183E6